MADWLYTLVIKDLLSDGSVDWDKASISAAPEAERRVRALMAKVERDLERGKNELFLEGLYEGLDEVADEFARVTNKEAWEEESAQAIFNGALEILYNVGDDGHAVWIA